MSAGACGPSPGSAPPGSSCNWCSGSWCSSCSRHGCRRGLPLVVAAVLLGAFGGGLLLSGRPPRGASRGARAFRAAASDIRDGLLARHKGPAIALASVVVVTGHLATLILAARTAGAIAPIVQLLPLAMLMLLATAVPTNIGGWGPREGVAAWAFGAAGLGAAQGVATATVYGLSRWLPSRRPFPCSPRLAPAPPQCTLTRHPDEVPTSGPDLVPAAGRGGGRRPWLSVPTPC